MQHQSPTLAAVVAGELARRSTELSTSWRRRSRVVSDTASADPRAEPGAAADADAPSRRAEPDGGAALVRAMALALGGGVTWRDEVMRAGWELGTDAHARDGSLHHLLRAFDTLGDVLLAAAGDALQGRRDGTPSSGVAVARCLDRALSLLRLSATRGYAQALGTTLRARFRTIRHDIRNPLGTIANAVALMSDESLPAETRASPRVRAMVARNARSIDDLLRTTLGDSAAALPALGDQPGTLRAVACVVRNELAQEATLQGVDIVVGDSLPGALIDSAAVELVLTSVIVGMLRGRGSRMAEPAELLIELDDADDRSAVVAVAWRTPGDAPSLPDDFSLARELCERSGSELVVGDDGRVRVRVPLAEREAAAPVPQPRLSGEQGHHVPGSRERADLEAGTL